MDSTEFKKKKDSTIKIIGSKTADFLICVNGYFTFGLDCLQCGNFFQSPAFHEEYNYLMYHGSLSKVQTSTIKL